MANKIGKYRFGARTIKKELCPLCLEELKGPVHVDCFPRGKVVVKRKNYALIKITKDEPVVERMLRISDNKQDDSNEFILLYVDKTLVGYKGRDKIRFIPGFSKKEYKQILMDYVPRNERKKNTFEVMWQTYNVGSKRNKANLGVVGLR